MALATQIGPVVLTRGPDRPPVEKVHPLRILLISTSIYALPIKGYGGTEEVVYRLACEFQKRGHQVSVVAPEGSKLPDGMELIPIALGELEETAYRKYANRLGEFDIIHDHTFGGWVYMGSIGVDTPLPIIKTFHTDPSIWGSPPPVQRPCLVGLSRDHARRLSMHLGVSVEYVYNGIDTTFYKPPSDPLKPRSSRLLFMGRYTPEKGALEAMQLCKRKKIPLDCYGDTTMVSNPAYVDRCRQEADEVIVRMFPGVPREETVELYQTHQALLFTPNWDEPFGLTMVEAQACGMLVIALNRGSVKEVVSHESGFVEDDLEDIEYVLDGLPLHDDDPQVRVKWVEENFSIAEMTNGYLRLYNRVRNKELW